MKHLVFVALLAVGSICAVGCVATGGDVGVAEAELRGGCHWECPRCRPNQPCIMMACRLVCRGGGGTGPVACGDNVCAPGDVCCNPSCGICTPPDGVCIQIACEPPTTGGCTSDADCRTFSDYCTGCDCRALGTSEPDPFCDGPGVRCFADPCMNQTATCNVATGACELSSATAI